MALDTVQYVLGAGSGGLVGFTLGLIGGGGSVLAVPLLVYLVRVPNPHIAIGTSALAVAANAIISLASHARAKTVIWQCGGVYAAAGIVGALAGSTLGKAIDGQKLLFLFALLMLLIGVIMLRGRGNSGVEGATCNRENAPKVLSFGFGTGLFSGFFGIGGGFLIVPGLIASTRMPMLNAVGTSLVAVTAFGLTTALNYAFSGMVDWGLAAMLIGGGFIGSIAGAATARRLAGDRGMLATIFVGVVFIVAFYMLWRSGGALFNAI
ncbi:sulfite exporter TauE/SafE family protein [Acidocella sp.]|uniref:sulfite exporter TauE/SafE family protein n=1 Tax=Acidocella sp. TaxID=50710 RepID=UPI003D05642B